MVMDMSWKRKKGIPGCLEAISPKHRLHIEGGKDVYEEENIRSITEKCHLLY